MTTEQSPPPTLSEERLAEMKEQYDAIEHKVVDPSRDFYVSSDESDKLIKFWTDLHNAFPSLLHAAEQMAQASQEIYILQMLLKDAKCPECDGSGTVVTLDRREQPYQMQCQWCHYKAEALKSLPPAPEKGGQGA